MPTDHVEKEIYLLQCRERIIVRETTKIEAEERLVKARTQVARSVEAVEEDDLLNDDIPGEMSESLNSIRNLFGAIPDKYLKQIYHDKFDPKNIIRLSQPLGTVQESHEDETKLDITATTIRIRRTTAALKEYGSTTTGHGLSACTRPYFAASSH